MDYSRTSYNGSPTSKVSSVVLDIQCFKDNDNEFIVKEASVVDLATGTLLLYHVALPPFDRGLLSEEKLRESYWLSKHCHGLDWNRGDIPYQVMMDQLRVCLSGRAVIYVKGLEKKIFVTKRLLDSTLLPTCRSIHTPPVIIDISDYGCGSLSSLSNLLSASTVRCGQHNSVWTRCALANSVQLRSWLLLTGNRNSHSHSSTFNTGGVDEVDGQWTPSK